jgi:hypothetical protein
MLIDPVELERLSSSKEFYEELKEAEANNPRFRELPSLQKRIGLALMMLGRVSLPELEVRHFRREIPTIQEFLTPAYIGADANILFGQWRKDLHEIFAPNSTIMRWGVTGAIGCVTGDTKVRLLDSRSYTIKELAEKGRDNQFWVFSWDISKGQMAPGKASNCHCSGRGVDVYEVCLSPQGRVKVTWDHPFLLTDGSYKKAIDLKAGDSIQSNHTVLNIESVGKDDVYDLTVDTFHNYGIDDGTGSLVFTHNTGKSTAGLIAQLYNLYRINSLRNPQLSMGTGPSKPMILQLFTVTKEKAQTTLIERVGILLSTCKDYVKVSHVKDFASYDAPGFDHLTPWVFTGDSFEFPNNIKIYAGSQDRHVLGEDVFGGLLDEAEFRIGSKGLVDKAFTLYDNIFERIRSRFLGARFVLMCLLSSIAHEKGVMATHIAELRNDPTGKVSQYSIWDTKYPDALRHDGHFWVMRGTQRHPSRVLSNEENILAERGLFDLPPSCTIVKVPRRYQADFQRRTEQSLMNLAGQASMGQEVPFDDLSKIEDNNLCPVLHVTAPLGNAAQSIPSPLRGQLPENLFVATPEGYRFKRYPAATRYGHWDGAAVSSAGLAIVHKELSVTGKVFYVADLVLKITSPNRINLEAVKEFIIDLRDYFGLGFKAFTADQYQSEQLLQKLTSIGYAETVQVLSVEKTRTPYDTLSTIVAQDCLKVGMMRDLKRELEGVYFENNKVFKQYIEGSHCDMADALCGAVHNAVMSLHDTPSNIYESFGHIRKTLDLLEGEFQRIN